MELFKKFLKNKDKKVVNNFYIALAVGILMLTMAGYMLMPTDKNNEVVSVDASEKKEDENDYTAELEKRLEGVLYKTYGVGEVDVMITTKGSRELIVAEDKVQDSEQSSEDNGSSVKKKSANSKTEGKVVILNDDTPLVLKEVKPEIEGVIIVATGGDNIEVKSAIIKATQAVLGIESNKIEVLKMK